MPYIYKISGMSRILMLIAYCALSTAQMLDVGDFCDFAGYDGTCLEASKCTDLELIMDSMGLENYNVGRCAFTITEEIICCPKWPTPVQTPPELPNAYIDLSQRPKPQPDSVFNPNSIAITTNAPMILIQKSNDNQPGNGLNVGEVNGNPAPFGNGNNNGFFNTNPVANVNGNPVSYENERLDAIFSDNPRQPGNGLNVGEVNGNSAPFGNANNNGFSNTKPVPNVNGNPVNNENERLDDIFSGNPGQPGNGFSEGIWNGHSAPLGYGNNNGFSNTNPVSNVNGNPVIDTISNRLRFRNLPVVQTPPKNLDPSPVESSTEGIQIGSNAHNVTDISKLDALLGEIFGKNASVVNEDVTEINTEGRQIASNDSKKLNELLEEIFGKNASAENENENKNRDMVSVTNDKFLQLFNKKPQHPDILDGSVHTPSVGQRLQSIPIEGERRPVGVFNGQQVPPIVAALGTTTVKPDQVPPEDLKAILNDIFHNGNRLGDDKDNENANTACETQHYKGVCKPRLQCTHLAQSLTDMRLKDNDVPLCGREDMICCPNLERPAVRACRAIERRLSPFQREHIFGGHNVSVMQYPHMAKIVYDQNEYVCGGTLIHERFVLTAAHCVIVRGTKPLKVIMGVADLTDTKSRSRQEIDIEATFDHRNYSSFSKYFDIALIKLVKDIKFSQTVYPTCLHTDPTELPDGVELTAAGWGRTENQSTSAHLMAVQLNKVPHVECNQSYANRIDHNLDHGIDDTQLCALAPGKDTCSGDSGGPLLLVKNATYNSYRIVGVVSFGDLMCGHTTPGVYTRVSAFLDFIESIVWPEALRKQ